MHIVTILAIAILVVILVIRNNSSGRDQIGNPRVADYIFLKHLIEDRHYPKHLIVKGQNILKELCKEIETNKPKNNEELYKLTHKATVNFNFLEEELELSGSELETMARENIGEDIIFIMEAYGFNADVEEAISPRNW